MSYVGNTPTQQAFSPVIDYFNGNASTTAFTLSRPVASVAQVQVVVNNVAQNPASAYTVNSNTITFTSAPSSGTNNIYVYYTSPITQVVALPQNPQVFGDLQFSSSSARITGDFSNATTANRVLFQSSTTNGNTLIAAIPNGTGTNTRIQAFSTSDSANASTISIEANGTLSQSLINADKTGTGTYLPMTFSTGGSERVRIDTSGNVGIGTSSPAATWGGFTSIYKDQNSYTRLIVNNQSAGSSASAETVLAAYGNSWVIGIGSSAKNSNALTFALDATASPPSEKMRIDTSGNLLVGTTSPVSTEKFGVLTSGASQMVIFRNSHASNPSGVQVSYTGTAPNNTGSEFYYGNDTVGLKFSARSNGGIANFSANNVNLSDRREKTNFAPAKSYLDVICAIPVQTFNYLDQNLEEDDGLTLGVVAQDVQAVAPELVMESDWSSKRDGSKVRLSIYQTDLQYALMKCIQEQQALITTLTDRITALENK
jgi:hypothetical protein